MRRRHGGSFALLAGVDVAGYRRRGFAEKVASYVDSRRGGRQRGRAGGGRWCEDVGGGGGADVQARAADKDEAR